MNTGRALVGRLIPDLDDELSHALYQVEELLLTLAVWEEDAADPVTLPAPLAHRATLDALNRVQAVINPTQSRTDRPTPGGRIVGPDGHYEHRPLRLVRLDPTDVDVLGAAAALLGRELATEPHGELADAMAAGAEAATVYGPAPRPVQLVEALARAHGLLDLAPTGDTAHLAELLKAAGDSDLVLTPLGEAAYVRTADRFNAMWALNSGLDRFLY
jgi:hypothetical protein